MLREIARRCGAGYSTVLNDAQQLRAAGALVEPVPPHLQPHRSRHDTPLARARVQAGMTQLELAERAGLSLETTCRMEAGEARPHAKTAARLAAAVGASVDLLWPGVQWPDPTAVVPPPGLGAPHGDPVHERRLVVAALYAKDTAPGAIARQREIGRATVYRDLAYLRDCGWDLPGRPYGRPPTPYGSADISEQRPSD